MILNTTSGKVLARKVEWMISPDERARGLLKYAEAPDDYGAIFRLGFGGFFPVIHTFGMKFPIDLAFCDSERKVVAVFRDIGPGRLVAPWKYIFGGCRYLVEFSRCGLENLKVGDVLGWVDG